MKGKNHKPEEKRTKLCCWGFVWRHKAEQRKKITTG